ncbi:MAG: hypothetical protein FJ125_04920 [Deltaproteobacteria bacterium]|nr:hypothetical protein [Deltaproteobacteria bacterium]
MRPNTARHRRGFAPLADHFSPAPPPIRRRWLLALLLAACSVIGGPPGCSSDPGQAVVAMVDGEPVTLQQFTEVILAEQGAGFFSQVFLVRYLVEREAQRAGITVDRQQVADAAIKAEHDALLSSFQGSKAVLEEMLKSRGMTVEGWRESLRREARHRVLTEQLWRVRTSNDDTELRQRFARRYGEDGLRRKIRLLSIGLDPTKSRLYTREEYEAETASLPGWLRSEAERLRGRALAGEKFEELVRSHSDAPDARDGGDLDTSWGEIKNDAVKKAATATPVGGLSPPIETPMGFELLEVHGKKKVSPTEERKQVRHLLLSRAYPAVKKRKLKEQIGALAASRAGELLGQLQQGADFADLARRFSEEPVSAAAGGEVPAEKYLTLPEELRRAAAQDKPGEPPRHLQTSSGHFLLQVLEEEQTIFEAVRPSLRKEIEQEHPTGRELESFAQRLVKENRVERLAPWL